MIGFKQEHKIRVFILSNINFIIYIYNYYIIYCNNYIFILNYYYN